VGRANWCQASAYCQWAGKRLCGKIGGGPLLDMFKFDANIAQWFNACSHGGTRDFPYGATYEAGRCVDPGPGNSANFVATKRGCEGGFPGLFDMSGNLWEWTDNCDNPTDQSFCRACGGAFDSAPPAEFQCNHCRNWTRTAYATDIGFRCCKDL
jgi:formylglycine-generating enzyme required for sulfatase activity